MNQIPYSMALSGISVLVLLGCGGLRGDEAVSDEQLACEALVGTLNLTLASAQLVEATDSTPQYCYVKGIISPGIVYHVQLHRLCCFRSSFPPRAAERTSLSINSQI